MILQGGDALNICLNTVAMVSMCEADNLISCFDEYTCFHGRMVLCSFSVFLLIVCSFSVFLFGGTREVTIARVAAAARRAAGGAWRGFCNYTLPC